MDKDPGSIMNNEIVYAAASVGASTVYTSSIDHGTKGPAVSYIISVGTFATSFVATLQYSDDDFDTDTNDEDDTSMGNEVSETLVAEGSAVIDCPNPRAQYTRVKMVLGGTCVICVAAVSGPKPHVIPANAT